MKRRIIQIDSAACNGCGACANACHEGAIEMVNGKATLMREHFCDGLGDCLPACPTGAITFIEREAPAYDEGAVKAAQQKNGTGCACPGSAAKALRHPAPEDSGVAAPSCLAQWPVQIKLAPVSAPWFDGADLLISADCAAYAFGDFHRRFIQGHVTLIGCPKLDAVDYQEKLTAILTQNAVRSVTVVRMEVPCCGGLQRAVLEAAAQCGRKLPLRVVTLSTDGRILSEEPVNG